MGTQQNFEKELLKLGYKPRAVNSSRLIKKFGPFSIRVYIYASPKVTGYYWVADCFCQIGPKGETVQLSNESYCSQKYDIKEFKQAQSEFTKYIKEEFIPHASKALDSKELTDLLKEK